MPSSEQLQAAAPGLAPAVLETLSEAMQARKRVRITEPCPDKGCDSTHFRWVEIPYATAAAQAAKGSWRRCLGQRAERRARAHRQESRDAYRCARDKGAGFGDNIEENLALMLTEPEQFQRTRGWLDAKAANGSAS
jgi:hypothetical protein